MALSLPRSPSSSPPSGRTRRPSARRTKFPMRTFFVERVYKPQVVMVCPKGESVPLRPEAEADRVLAAAPEDHGAATRRSARRPPARRTSRRSSSTARRRCSCPQGWDYTFICPTCLSYGSWIDTGRPRRTRSSPPPSRRRKPRVPRRDDPAAQAHGDGEGREPHPEALRRDGADRLHGLRLRLRGLRGGARRRQRRRTRTSACRARKRRRRWSRIC